MVVTPPKPDKRMPDLLALRDAGDRDRDLVMNTPSPWKALRTQEELVEFYSARKVTAPNKKKKLEDENIPQ